MRGRDLTELSQALYKMFGNENYLLFKVGEESNEVGHSIFKLLATLHISGHNANEQEELWKKVSEEFAQLEVYMALVKPFLLVGEMERAREAKILAITNKINNATEHE